MPDHFATLPPSDECTPVVSLSHIGKQHCFDGKPVSILKDISLDIFEGDYCSITGPSGCGKTTLLYIMGLLDQPTMGTYVLDGVSTRNASPAERACLRSHKIGFIFQNFYLMPALSAIKNVALPLVYRGANRGEAMDRAAEALRGVGLGHRTRHTPDQLSGGQQQRVAIARALVGGPRLLLADEPTGNLDPTTTMEMLDLIEEANLVANMTIALITHDPNVANHAPRELRFIGGRLLEGDIDHGVAAAAGVLAPISTSSPS